MSTALSLTIFSDTHLRPLEPILRPYISDVGIHCGDTLNSGSKSDFLEFLIQLERVRSKFKRFVYVPGNHDIYVEKQPDACRKDLESLGVDLLINQEIVIEGKRIYGSPYTPRFGRWAFMLDRGEAIRKVWDQIPEGLDVLITHGPPKGILDLTDGRYTGHPENVGCEELYDRLTTMEKPPRISAFGHIHASYAMKVVGKTTYYNAAICNEDYQPMNKPWEVEI